MTDIPRRYNAAFERIRDDFHIDILKMPHLLGSFTVFRPTRIEENFKGFQSDDAAGSYSAPLTFPNKRGRIFCARYLEPEADRC